MDDAGSGGHLELLAEEQILDDEALRLRTVVTKVAQTNRTSSSIAQDRRSPPLQIAVRPFAAYTAWVARMWFWTFQAYTSIGGVAWAIEIGAIGYYLGSNWSLIERVAGYLGLGGLAVAGILVVVLFLLWRRVERN